MRGSGSKSEPSIVMVVLPLICSPRSDSVFTTGAFTTGAFTTGAPIVDDPASQTRVSDKRLARPWDPTWGKVMEQPQANIVYIDTAK